MWDGKPEGTAYYPIDKSELKVKPGTRISIGLVQRVEGGAIYTCDDRNVVNCPVCVNFKDCQIRILPQKER